LDLEEKDLLFDIAVTVSATVSILLESELHLRDFGLQQIMDGLDFVGSCSVVLDSETRETKPCHQNRRARRGEGDDETTVRVWTNRQFYALCGSNSINTTY
jgi:hypothetical protein